MLGLSQSLIVAAPTKSIVDFPNIGQNTLVATLNRPFYALECLESDDCTRTDYITYIKTEYPDIANLLVCIWEKESTYGTNLVGDNGKATGHFQVWLSLHPDIDRWCANDFFCSLDWTAKKIKEGKAYLWSTYRLCK